MKRIYRILVVVPLMTLGVAAQDEAAARAKELARQAAQLAAQQADLQAVQDNLKQAVVISLAGAVMGPAVKNAPYSAVEVTENSQTLADGTRIHRENQTTVYRDSEGRVRRETPEQVTIWDPVAGTSYSLNPKTQIARKLPLGAATFLMAGRGGRGEFGTFVARQEPVRVEAGQPFQTKLTGPGKEAIVVEGGRGGRGPAARAGKTESLGKQMIEGVNSEGTRTSSTIEAGAIGNDRPIQITSETWYSSELQTQMKTVHSDPRSGEEVFRLTNVSRAEPPSILFQVPADYQIIDRK